MNQKYFFFAFFSILLFLGVCLHSDYGVPLDEPAQRLIGIVNLNYVANLFGISSILDNAHFANFSKQSLMELEDRHYGVIFELPAAFMEMFVNPPNEQTVYFVRHLMTFVCFLFGMATLYSLAKLRYKSCHVSLLACLLLLLSPRIFADAFYNSKDIVFLSTFALASLTMVWFLTNPNWKRCLLHAITTAIAIDTRLIAIAFPMMTIALLGIRYGESKLTFNQLIKQSLIYLTVCILVIILLWPYLWTNPIAHLIEAFEYISRHPHSAALNFQGKEILTNELPWYYLPTWISITTPILYLIFFCFGCVLSFKSIIKSKFKVFENQDRLLDIVFLGLFFGPISVIALSHTSIYNGWRHLYFVYPFFILISINGLLEIWRLSSIFKYGRKFIAGIITINFLWISHWMYINHPLQNLYFNALAGSNWNNLYEVDYWGLANRIALKKILESDHRPQLLVWPGSNSKFKSGEPTVFTDQLMLEHPNIKAKIHSPDNIEDAQYVIASNRANYTPDHLSNHGMFRNIDNINVDNSSIVSVFRLISYDELAKPLLNKSISFARNGAGIYYLYGNKNPPINWEQWDSNGWQIPENWGAWSKGTSSTLKLPTPDNQIKSMSIKLRAFVNKDNPTQSVDIWINGKSIKTITLSNSVGEEFTIELPSDLKISKDVEIQFKGLTPLSPKKLGLSNDDRQIAIGIESIEFN